MRGNLRFGLYKGKIADRYDTMRIFNFDDILKSVRSLFEGKIIPAPVALQLSMWEKEKLERAYELAQQQLQEDQENLQYYHDLTDEQKQIYEFAIGDLEKYISGGIENESNNTVSDVI